MAFSVSRQVKLDTTMKNDILYIKNDIKNLAENL